MAAVIETTLIVDANAVKMDWSWHTNLVAMVWVIDLQPSLEGIPVLSFVNLEKETSNVFLLTVTANRDERWSSRTTGEYLIANKTGTHLPIHPGAADSFFIDCGQGRQRLNSDRIHIELGPKGSVELCSQCILESRRQ